MQIRGGITRPGRRIFLPDKAMASSIAWGSFGAVWLKTKRKQMRLVGGNHFCFEKNF